MYTLSRGYIRNNLCTCTLYPLHIPLCVTTLIFFGFVPSQGYIGNNLCTSEVRIRSVYTLSSPDPTLCNYTFFWISHPMFWAHIRIPTKFESRSAGLIRGWRSNRIFSIPGPLVKGDPQVYHNSCWFVWLHLLCCYCSFPKSTAKH